jgi:hypothetical protein
MLTMRKNLELLYEKEIISKEEYREELLSL